MGMPVGGKHIWMYPNGTWKEEKVEPDCWVFTFESVKQRERQAPENSGAKKNTQYHWYILADQSVRKIDKDSYETLMEGVKYKLSHKRPHWRKWSSQYEGNVSERDRIMEILVNMQNRLSEGEPTKYESMKDAYLRSIRK
jgi:hypothetical protein